MKNAWRAQNKRSEAQLIWPRLWRRKVELRSKFSFWHRICNWKSLSTPKREWMNALKTCYIIKRINDATNGTIQKESAKFSKLAIENDNTLCTTERISFIIMYFTLFTTRIFIHFMFLQWENFLRVCFLTLVIAPVCLTAYLSLNSVQ